jgi:hypothetical protein
LIEIMVAMTILVTVIGALAVLSAKTSERARLAEVLAQRNYTIVQQMNRLNALPFDSLKLYTAGKVYDTIPSGIPQLRFLRRDTVYYLSAAAADTNEVEAKVTIMPLSANKRDTVYRDSIAIRRRNPRLTSPLNY